MKLRRLVYVASTLILTLVPIDSSHAIFGLSKCEKVKKSIQIEEQIGLQLWKSWNSTRLDWHKKQYVLTRADDITLADLLLPIYQSDARVYKIALGAPQCFTTTINANVRSENNETQGTIDAIQRFEKNSDYPVLTLNQLWVEYPKYYSVYGNLLGS